MTLPSRLFAWDILYNMFRLIDWLIDREVVPELRVTSTHRSTVHLCVIGILVHPLTERPHQLDDMLDIGSVLYLSLIHI